MTEIIRTTHYNGEVAIKFYPGKHAYQLEGHKDYLIGVTTATGMMDKSRALMIWASRLTKDYLVNVLNSKQIEIEDIESAVTQYDAVRDEAATIGTMAHDWVDQYVKGLNPTTPDDERVANAVTAFLKWVNQYQVRFVFNEKVVYSRKHEYVGTMDCAFTMGAEGHKIIHPGDYKTSSGLYVNMAFQVAAYQEAESEEHGTVYGDKWLLRFSKEDKFDKNGKLTQVAGDFEAKCFPREEHDKHFQGFLACLELKKQQKEWDKKYGFYAKAS